MLQILHLSNIQLLATAPYTLAIPLLEQLDAVEDLAVTEERVSGAARDDTNGNRVGARNDRAGRNRNIIHLTEPPVRTASNTAQVEVFGGGGNRSGPRVDLSH